MKSSDPSGILLSPSASSYTDTGTVETYGSWWLVSICSFGEFVKRFCPLVVWLDLPGKRGRWGLVIGLCCGQAGQSTVVVAGSVKGTTLSLDQVSRSSLHLFITYYMRPLSKYPGGQRNRLTGVI